MNEIDLIAKLKALDAKAVVFEDEAEGLKERAATCRKNADNLRSEANKLLREFDVNQVSMALEQAAEEGG